MRGTVFTHTGCHCINLAVISIIEISSLLHLQLTAIHFGLLAQRVGRDQQVTLYDGPG